METDLTSIIIGLAALATFFVPIGLHEFSHKQKIKKTHKAFDAIADKNSFHIDDVEILRNGQSHGEKLIFFEGKEMSAAVDESIIIQRWIGKINAAQK